MKKQLPVILRDWLPTLHKGFRSALLILMVLSQFTAASQNRNQVRGTVVDEKDQALPGVTIMVKGENAGTTSEIDGTYNVTLPNAGATLVFSFVGYVTQEVQTQGRQEIDIKLLPDLQALNELIVVGYGTQKKVNLSGAVDQVDAKVLENRPISNVSQGLQGLIPNLNIQFSSGAPGASADINIRGITSINGGSPLILIDGVQSSSGELNLLAPQDIASISVIKDASAAAIYGARAAFGVILIQTKSGTDGGIRVAYSNNFTWNKPTVFSDKITDPYIFSRLLETSTDNTPWDNVNYNDQFYQYARERSDDPTIAGVRINPSNPKQWEYMGNRDWTRYFLGDYNFTTNHDLSVSGKSDNNKARYFLSGGYNRQNSPLTLADDYFDRYTMRSKVDYNLTSWLNLGNNTSMTTANRKSPSQLNIFDIYNYFPTEYNVNPDGTWANTGVGRGAAAIVDGGVSTNKEEVFQSRFTSEVALWKRFLVVNADFTHRRSTENYNRFTTKYNIGFGPNDVREEGSNTASRSGLFSYYNVFNIYGTLAKDFGRHAFTSVLGFGQEDYREEVFGVSKTGVISGTFPTIGLATGETSGTESISTYALRGAFYRLNYIYDNRYIVEFNGRYDGSSRFPKDRRYGFFPSGSVAWRVDQEPFLKSIFENDISLKIRASYGSLGNQAVSNYGFIPSMGTYQFGYLINGARPFAIGSPPLVSSNYSWEKVNTVNFGVDLDLFKNRFSAVFDIYRRNTLDMLTLGKQLPGILGAAEPRENAADLQTKGWELSLSYRDQKEVAGSPLSFETRFILSDSKSKITRFDNPNKSILQYYEGMNMGEIWGLKSDGLFKNTDEIQNLDETSIIPWGALQIVPGWPKFVDMDGNGKIEKGYTVGDTKDLSVIGNSTPRFQYGMDMSASWKNFDFRIFFQGIGKRDYYPIDYLYWGHYQQPYGNTYTHLLDFYRAETESSADRARHSKSYLEAGLADQNLDAKFPILQSWLADANLGTRIDESMGTAIPQTRYLLNAAYLRLKNLTVGYSLPVQLCSKIGISKLRVFFSGENITEWSALKKFYDPEGTNANINTNPTTSTGRNGNGMMYPFQRSYSFGLNLVF